MNANELTFGVELETTIPAGAIPVGSYHNAAAAVGLPVGWNVKHDGSIRAGRGRQGAEFVSPILRGADGIASVIAAVRAIVALGGKVNGSTGCHVHVGWNGTPAALNRLITLVANFETAIYASTGTKKRQTGRWCRGVQRYGAAVNARANAQVDRYPTSLPTPRPLPEDSLVTFSVRDGAVRQSRHSLLTFSL